MKKKKKEISKGWFLDLAWHEIEVSEQRRRGRLIYVLG